MGWDLNAWSSRTAGQWYMLTESFSSQSRTSNLQIPKGPLTSLPVLVFTIISFDLRTVAIQYSSNWLTIFGNNVLSLVHSHKRTGNSVSCPFIEETKHTVS